MNEEKNPVDRYIINSIAGRLAEKVKKTKPQDIENKAYIDRTREYLNDLVRVFTGELASQKVMVRWESKGMMVFLTLTRDHGQTTVGANDKRNHGSADFELGIGAIGIEQARILNEIFMEIKDCDPVIWLS